LPVVDRSVVISGGGTGIGKATAAAFARLGDRVLILGRRREPLADAAAEIGDRVGWQTVDLADPKAVDALELPDAVDVLVNNAGGVTRDGELAERFQADFRMNVLTAVLLTEKAGPRLRRPGGRVINLSSIAALRGGGDSYGASKAAVIGWSYTLAAELGPDGITVNVVAPGYVADTEFFADTMTDERRASLVGSTLNGRAGAPSDVAASIVYLASPEAAHVTGQVLQVNGGALLGRG
jgi:NAD(P)-dependent dehydrogenase (short-subunit alcohol dehydrogenase family)